MATQNDINNLNTVITDSKINQGILSGDININLNVSQSSKKQEYISYKIMNFNSKTIMCVLTLGQPSGSITNLQSLDSSGNQGFGVSYSLDTQNIQQTQSINTNYRLYNASVYVGSSIGYNTTINFSNYNTEYPGYNQYPLYFKGLLLNINSNTIYSNSYENYYGLLTTNYSNSIYINIHISPNSNPVKCSGNYIQPYQIVYYYFT